MGAMQVTRAGVVIALLCGCAGRMPLIGLDKDGKPTHAFVSEEKFKERVTEGLIAVGDSVVPVLNSYSGKEGANWKLRTAVIGFGAKAEAGIGPFKVGIKPRIRAAFANGEKPPIP